LFFIVFFICFLCFHSQRSFGFGESGLLFLSGKHSSTVVHTKFTIVSGLFFHLPQHHMAGPGGGYLDAFTTGQGLDTGGLFSFGLFPSVIFGSQEKDVHAAMHDARL
jgi:hypothetical protein